MFIESSPAIANLFTRAEEGAAREDWKFTIDCLQRVIDKPQGSLVPRYAGAAQGGVLYESARRRAVKRVAALPPDGLAAYRLLFDGRARRLLERGRSEHNPDDLRDIVHRYLLTRFGDDAADLLASWALDAGRPSEAVRLLSDLIALVPDADVPRGLLVAKLAVAYALLGQSDEAWALMTVNAADSGTSAPLERIGESLPGRMETAVVDAGAAWPVRGGSAARHGKMAAVKPTIVEAAPWRYRVAGAPADAWRRVYHDDPHDRLILPTAQAVADRKRLFLRTPTGCIALDRNDLLERWHADLTDADSSTPDVDPDPFFDIVSVIDPGSATDDYISADLAQGLGLVTLVAEGGAGTYVTNGRDKSTVYGVQWIPGAAATNPTRVGTRIVALDADTGRIVWQRGRTGHPADPLGDVDFRAAPLAVAGRFWVPYFRHNDLYVAVLDSADGALIESVPLCSVGTELDVVSRRSEGLPLAAADGVVFVPSNYGVLFGLDAYDLTLRWAAQFQPSLTRDALLGASGPARWLPGPPVVVGDGVVIGAREAGTLLAFAGATGEFRWSARLDGAAYLIGSDQGRIWVGGRTLSCVSAKDGEVLWSSVLPSIPTGHGVLAGDKVLVPLLDGLLTLGADSGEPLEYASLPSDENPPGNLLSLDDSLLMLGPSGVRRFPDIDRCYPIARAAYDRDPTDPSLVIRLAWLELLRGEPQRAFDILETQAVAASVDDPLRAAETVRLRVEALLAIAQRIKSGGGTDGDALDVLVRAGAIAESPQDRLRCGLAIAHKLSMLGRHAEAFRRLWDLGVSPTGDQIVTLGEHVSGLARFDIAQRLVEVGGKLTDAERLEIIDSASREVGRIASQLDEPSDSRTSKEQLRAMADLDRIGAVRELAASSLAAYLASSQRFEGAEQLLRYHAHITADPQKAARHLVMSCRSYASAVSVGVPAATAVLAGLNELEALSARVKLPDSIVGDEAATPDAGLAGWLRQRRAAMLEHLGWDPDGRAARSLALTGQLGWSIPARERMRAPRLIRIEESGPSALADRVFLQESDNQIHCVSAGDGELLWSTTLRLPETFSRSPERQVRRSQRPGPEPPRRAVADGQTGVFTTEDGLFAVGLATGRRLWARAYDATTRKRQRSDVELCMDAADGLLAAMPRDGRLAMMRLQDGEILWERDLRGERVSAIQMRRGRVLTMDAGQERVHIFDRENGSLVKRVLFDQPDPRRGPVQLVEAGGVLCGPAAPNGAAGIQGVDVTTGETLWRERADKPVVAMFHLQPDYLGVGLLGGNVRIVDAQSGELLVEHNVPGAHVVVDGALVDGTLLARHHSSRDERRDHVISALDVATGEELWKRSDLLTTATFADTLKVYGDRLLTAKQEMETGRNRRFELRFGVLDIRTGEPVGPETPILRGHDALQLNGDLAVYPQAGVAVFGADKAVVTLKVAMERGTPREGL